MNRYYYLCVWLLLIAMLYGQEQNKSIKLSLREAINTAIQNNPEARLARLYRLEVEGKYLAGISPSAPEFSISNDVIPAGKGINKYQEQDFSISQKIDFPTKYFLRESILGIQKQLTRYENAVIMLELVAKVKKAYYKVLASTGQLQIARENLNIAELYANKAEFKYQAGESTRLELLTVKVQMTEARNELKKAESKLIFSIEEFNQALGYRDTEKKELVLTDSLSETLTTIETHDELHPKLSVHPLLQRELTKEFLSVEEKKMAWSGLLPDVTLAYAKQTREGQPGYYGVSMSFSVPLWFMLQNRGEIETAEVQVQIAKEKVKQANIQLHANLNNAVSLLLTEEQQMKLYKTELLPQAVEVFNAAEKSYEAGEIGYVEFLQAKQILITTKSSYIGVLLDYHNALIDVETVIGTNF